MPGLAARSFPSSRFVEWLHSVQDHRTELSGQFVKLVARPLVFCNAGIRPKNRLDPLDEVLGVFWFEVGNHALQRGLESREAALTQAADGIIEDERAVRF